MRNGVYAVYKGKEYEAGRSVESNVIVLRSYNPNDVSKGFSLYKGIVYVKRVQRSELEEVYRISTFADYKGIKLRAMKEDRGKILLVGIVGDYRIFESLGMKMVDKGVYEKWVDKSDVTAIYEEKEPL
ncbi:hypothetical protein [Acetivibrio saccincola]|jgi:hypothetical protein|uniref:Uncharacterized protein n=1 Tax=Acetivibrio saccincola TaxID=1677857 RepID=A0A2K9EE46_9FIRM|nr:hypothetical protein [Acetivibrio saccincola]AUG56153.1 hypothetical protein HVS_00895 [Acetivibrio saccincola]